MAGVYDIFVNVINGKTHKALRQIVSVLIQPGDTVLDRFFSRGWQEFFGY